MDTILEIIDKERGVFVYCDYDSIPENSNPLNKTVRELVKDAIASGKRTGHEKYRKILLDEGIISSAEYQKCKKNYPQEKELKKPSIATGLTT